MARKRKKTRSRRTLKPAESEVYLISQRAIQNSTGVPEEEAAKISTELGDDHNHHEVVVVTLDIRKSSIALVNAEDFVEYSAIVTDYVCYVAAKCMSEQYSSEIELGRNEPGWFDKFTGDGVLLFWRLPLEPTPEKYAESWPEYYKRWRLTVRSAIAFSVEVVGQFLRTALPDIRTTCGYLPSDFGISAGIDAGTCLLTEMESSEEFEERCKSYGIEYKGKMRISPNVTAIGRSVIGAVRMVSGAGPYEILVNSYPGAALQRGLEESGSEVAKRVEFSLEPAFVPTKEYGSGVEAYRVISSQLEELKRRLAFVRMD